MAEAQAELTNVPQVAYLQQQRQQQQQLVKPQLAVAVVAKQQPVRTWYCMCYALPSAYLPVGRVNLHAL
jgi:hypothetical protein